MSLWDFVKGCVTSGADEKASMAKVLTCGTWFLIALSWFFLDRTIYELIGLMTLLLGYTAHGKYTGIKFDAEKFETVVEERKNESPGA
jgi:hypothetical protein